MAGVHVLLCAANYSMIRMHVHVRIKDTASEGVAEPYVFGVAWLSLDSNSLLYVAIWLSYSV